MKMREVVPREHGAWAMWIVPMITAALVSQFRLSLLLLFVSFGLLYLVHHPVVRLIKTGKFSNRDEKKFVLLAGIPALIIALSLVLFFELYWLICFGMIELALFVLSVKAFVAREQRTYLNEFTVAAALTFTGPAAYYAITGTVDINAVQLYILNFLFFGSSIFYVRTRIEFLKAKGVSTRDTRLSGFVTVIYHIVLVVVVLLLSICGSTSILMLLAFAPMIAQATFGLLFKKGKLDFSRLGIALVLQSLFFLAAVRVFWK
ncbi:MAG TPA: YwiC-like family protein [Candidatus Kryptonia bacterium]